jgi:small subunit ribosomal protein S20
MANTKSAIKKVRSDKRKTAINFGRKNRLKNAVRKFKSLLPAKVQEAKEFYPVLQKRLDITAKTGVMHKNKSSRLKSKFKKLLNEKSTG